MCVFVLGWGRKEWRGSNEGRGALEGCALVLTGAWGGARVRDGALLGGGAQSGVESVAAADVSKLSSCVWTARV